MEKRKGENKKSDIKKERCGGGERERMLDREQTVRKIVTIHLYFLSKSVIKFVPNSPMEQETKTIFCEI